MNTDMLYSKAYLSLWLNETDFSAVWANFLLNSSSKMDVESILFFWSIIFYWFFSFVPGRTKPTKIRECEGLDIKNQPILCRKITAQITSMEHTVHKERGSTKAGNRMPAPADMGISAQEQKIRFFNVKLKLLRDNEHLLLQYEVIFSTITTSLFT